MTKCYWTREFWVKHSQQRAGNLLESSSVCEVRTKHLIFTLGEQHKHQLRNHLERERVQSGENIGSQTHIRATCKQNSVSFRKNCCSKTLNTHPKVSSQKVISIMTTRKFSYFRKTCAWRLLYRWTLSNKGTQAPSFLFFMDFSRWRNSVVRGWAKMVWRGASKELWLFSFNSSLTWWFER